MWTMSFTLSSLKNFIVLNKKDKKSTFRELGGS